MKTFTFLLLAIFATFSVQAQLFVIDSPASVAGSYSFATTTDDATSVPWGITTALADSVWCAELAFLDDGIDPGGDGCTPAINDLTGKFAVIDRGACNFSLKVYHAQDVGATAVIIINNPGGAALGGMLGGDSAAAVVIPAIFLELVDGEPIQQAMNDGPVTGCMGNIVFDNDISISFESTQLPLYGTVPANQIESLNALGSAITPALRVSNNGLLDANNVVGGVTINFTPSGGASSEVFTGSATATALPIDTSILLSTSEYDYSGSDAGAYEIIYTISADESDQQAFDNEVTSTFNVSENAFSKGQWDDANNRPFSNAGFTIAGGGPIEMISGFNVPAGLGNRIDSVQFQCSTSNASLEGIIIKVNVYRWDDLNVDSIYNNDELTLVGVNNVTFDATNGGDGTAAWVTLPVLDAMTLADGHEIPSDGGYYLVGTRYEGGDLVFFGFNTNYDHTITNELALFPTFADFPYFQVTTFPGQIPDIESGGLFTDFFGTLSQAMYVNPVPMIESTDNILSEVDAKINLYPNPVAEVLTADVTLSELTSDMIYKITDATGRLIFSTQVQNVKTDKAEFNVAQLPTGQYFLTIQTDKGIRTEAFNVNR